MGGAPGEDEVFPGSRVRGGGRPGGLLSAASKRMVGGDYPILATLPMEGGESGGWGRDTSERRSRPPSMRGLAG